MDSGTAMTLLKLLATDKYAGAAKGAASGDSSILSMLFNAAGLPNPSGKDLQDLQVLAAAFGNVVDPDSTGNTDTSIDWSDADTVNQLRKEASGMEQLLNGDPRARAIKAGIQLVGDAARMGGNIAANNGNQLAAALMAANRTNSNRQNELYGPSRREAATEAVGHERIRKGNNWKIVGDTVGNFVDKLLGTYNMNSATAANAALTRQLAKEGLSSGAFDQLGRSVTANKNIMK